MLPALTTTAQASLKRLDQFQRSLWWQKISTQQKQWCLGLVFIFAVTVIWVIASFVVQEVESAGLHPFLLSYIANSLFIVYLPIHWLVSQGTAKAKRQKVRSTPLPTTRSERVLFCFPSTFNTKCLSLFDITESDGCTACSVDVCAL